MAVAAQKRDTVTGPDSCLAQRARQPGRPFGKLRIAQLFIAAYHRNLSGKLLLRIAQEAYWSERNVHGVVVSI
jgi:hypothetical protein